MKKYDSDDLINEISNTLALWDGKDLAEIAEQVLGHSVKYELMGNQYFIISSFFKDDPIVYHDATHYGCRVDEKNVTE